MIPLQSASPNSSDVDSEQRPSSSWNDTHHEYPLDVFTVQLIARQARRSPDAIALVSSTETFTYRELEIGSNRLARRLKTLGVGPDVIVGLFLASSPAMVMSALAVWKAGGAYLPLDPSYPENRVAFMLNETKAPVVITRNGAADKVAQSPEQLIDLDQDAALLASQSDDDLPASTSGEHLAYVIFTSGSTGQPKGVQITHKGLLNLVHWHARSFSVTPADRASQLSSISFDAAVWEVWPYLASGASVHFAEPSIRLAPGSLQKWLLEENITITFVPPVLAEQLIALTWPVSPALRVLLTGADTLHKYPPSDLPFLLVNNYGPTECTVVTTSGAVRANGDSEIQPSIGRPIDNVQVYILDHNLSPMPVGEPGELYIGGAGLTRGYLNRPDLDAEKLVPNPFSKVDGERLYRTGDLARYLPNGEIAFVGRIDTQVKIRGYRIEPDEIAAVLSQCPEISAATVVAREDTAGELRLTAYVVSPQEIVPERSKLQEFLAKRLPDYMVPSTFVRVDSLPVTPNGKIDRAALPQPLAGNIIGDRGVAAPRTVVEQRLVEIVSKLLKLEHVGVNDNFFLVGGHSLLGAQLVAKVSDLFGIEVPLRSIFDYPTVAGLSGEIERLILSKIEGMSPEDVKRELAQSEDEGAAA
jgi:amino acid adenylation domain-containing protein